MPDAPVEEVDAVHEEHAHTTELVVAGPGRGDVIRPLDLTQTREAMQSYQEGLRALLGADDWQGPPGAKGSFVKKSGWRKIATWFGLDIVRVHEEVERDEEGMALRASYTAAAIAPNGRRVEATGHCAFAESRFSGPRGNATKLENDLRATAETRAKNRAVADIVGMGAVSAEEIAAGSPESDQKWGPEASEKLQETLAKAAAYLLDTGDEVPDQKRALELFNAIGTRYGYVPQVAAQSIVMTAAALKSKVEGDPAPAATPEPVVKDTTEVTGKSDIPTEEELAEIEAKRAAAAAAAATPSGLDPDDEEPVDADVVPEVNEDQGAMDVGDEDPA